MNDRELIMSAINRMMESASPEVLTFLYFYLVESGAAGRKEKAD